MESIQSVTQIADDKSGFSLTASHLLEYLFCPRFTYFEYVLDIPQHEDKRFKVEVGRTIHEKIRKMNADYLRKKIGDLLYILVAGISWSNCRLRIKIFMNLKKS